MFTELFYTALKWEYRWVTDDKDLRIYFHPPDLKSFGKQIDKSFWKNVRKSSSGTCITQRSLTLLYKKTHSKNTYIVIWENPEMEKTTPIAEKIFLRLRSNSA